jgi:hypothetical protein
VPLWWLGIVLHIGGELGNLFAYGFAPASIVTPVGSIGVLCNAFLATLFLKEPLRAPQTPNLRALPPSAAAAVAPPPPPPLTSSTTTSTITFPTSQGDET